MYLRLWAAWRRTAALSPPIGLGVSFAGANRSPTLRTTPIIPAASTGTHLQSEIKHFSCKATSNHQRRAQNLLKLEHHNKDVTHAQTRPACCAFMHLPTMVQTVMMQVICNLISTCKRERHLLQALKATKSTCCCTWSDSDRRVELKGTASSL
jgi:hypothetical protein